ncbi:MAG: PriCT-2 domain-containing protein, partial [Ruthenibacterium sp.]
MEHGADLQEALNFLHVGNLTYAEWTTVGMGIKEAGLSCELWENWSARDSRRYHRGECTKKWDTFKGCANPVTENSIFKLARDHGWVGPAGHELDWNDT